MSRYRRMELIEEPYSFFPTLFFKQTSIFTPKSLIFPSFVEDHLDVGFALDLLNRGPLPSPVGMLDTVTDLLCVDHSPAFSAYKRIQRVERLGTELCLQSLCDRVSELESGFDRLTGSNFKVGERKYTLREEIELPEKNGFDRKYKWVAEIKQREDIKKKKKEEEKKAGIAKNYKWTAEIKGKGANGAISRTYTIKASSGDTGESNGWEKKEKEKEKEKKCKKEKKVESRPRTVEIEEPSDNGAIVLRQVLQN